MKYNLNICYEKIIMEQLFRLEKTIQQKNLQNLKNAEKINRYELEYLYNVFDIYQSNFIKHYDECEVDSDVIDEIIDTKYGYGYNPPSTIKKSGIAISYGVIVFYWDSIDKKEYYLIAQRRDSITYADFIRGKYKFEYLQRYFTLMTKTEREILKQYTNNKYSFEELWNDMHIINKNDVKSEIKAKKAWSKIESHNILNYLLNETHSNITETDWEFPKGRKMKNEDSISCAMREFEEEVNINSDNLIMLRRSKPFITTFYGSNDKLYQTILFPALMKRMIIPEKKHMNNLIRKEYISQEVSRVKWVSFDELKRHMNKTKYEFIEKEFRPWLYENITDNGYMKCGIRKSSFYNFRSTI